MAKPKTIKDHLGQEFRSKTAMCKHWEISLRTYNRRVDKGWSQQRALETSPSAERNNALKSELDKIDHLGNVYITKTAMCKHYGITRAVYDRRKQLGWNVKEILETPIRHSKKQGMNNVCKKKIKDKCDITRRTDHLGNVYKSRIDMCRAWKQNVDLVDARTDKYGWSLKDALEIPKKEELKEQLKEQCPSIIVSVQRTFILKRFVYYKCTCRQCGISTLMNYKEICEHKCTA